MNNKIKGFAPILSAILVVTCIGASLSSWSPTVYEVQAMPEQEVENEDEAADEDAAEEEDIVQGSFELDDGIYYLDSDYGIAPTYVYGVYLTTSDGAEYALKQSEHLWTPSKYYEAAWDTIDNDYYSSMEGKAITTVTYITTYGIVEYTLSESQYVTPHMEDVPTVVFIDGETIYITGIADDAEGVTITVKASGRNGTSLTDDAKTIAEDGTVALDTAATDGTTYKVTISSSNYATNIVSVVYFGVDKSALKTAYDVALALNESDYTVSSWNAFETALVSAEAVLTDADVTQEEVDSAEAALTSATASLVNISALAAAVETAEALTESDYTADSWEALKAALTSAAVVLADEGAAQDEVDSSEAVLTSALASLVKVSASTDDTDTDNDASTGATSDDSGSSSGTSSTGSSSGSTASTDGSSTSMSATSTETGDSADLWIWVMLAMAAVAAGGVAVKRRKNF